MYPALPLGPLSVPTGPFLAIFAVIVGLELASRAGRRLALHPDDVWNSGLLALAAGLIVARIWTIIQFWDVYASEPLLMVSLRPSGFAFWPGLIAAFLAGYGYLLWRALDPVRIAASIGVGALAAGVVLSTSAHLTGALLGAPSSGPWAMPYFGEMLHPLGLYQAAGLLVATVAVWFGLNPLRPGRTILHTLLGYSLMRLAVDAFVVEPDLIGVFRRSQVVALVVAVAVALLLANLRWQERAAPMLQGGDEG